MVGMEEQDFTYYRLKISLPVGKVSQQSIHIQKALKKSFTVRLSTADPHFTILFPIVIQSECYISFRK